MMDANSKIKVLKELIQMLHLMPEVSEGTEIHVPQEQEAPGLEDPKAMAASLADKAGLPEDEKEQEC